MNKISIIIPVWNEEENIKTLVNRIHSSLKSEKIEYEIIFLDDNSTDNTSRVISYLKNLFPISYYKKQGKKGKSFSLIEGFNKAKYDIYAMIDADLQYPPEELVPMIQKIKKGADVVVAKRNKSNIPFIRKIASKTFKFLFGKTLFGLDHDIQAGMKVFKKQVYETVKFNPKTGWSFDLEFLHRSRFAGFKIKNHEITFEKRAEGKSKISIVKTAFELGANALSVRFKPINPLAIKSSDPYSSVNAGFGYKQKKYVTHTNIEVKDSAVRTFLFKQKLFIFAVLALLAVGIFENILLTLQIFIAFISVVYFLDVLFNFWIISKSIGNNQEIYVSEEEIEKVWDKDLPIYTILCPLYKEAHVLPHFLRSIDRLDYPRKKLDVLLLLEEDDKVTIDSISKMDLPSYVRTIIVPDSQPKTKPKACNYGLLHAKGDYVVIYDAEDMPDPLQLKKAYIAFEKVGKKVVCLQAKLNYYNPHQNLLTRLFTAEYSLWFDVTLTGLQSLNTSLPLGGTSNHFRTSDLKKLSGWDPFNVAEDADLGIRLFRKGYQTAMIDSVTLEEANSKLGNWVRQRSRWIKGYMQTYLVHTREMFGFGKTKKKLHAVIFHSVVGGKLAFILINPLLWITTILYFAFRSVLGPMIEQLFPPVVFYIAIFSLTIGNFLFIYYYMLGVAKKGQWNLVKFALFVPLYWIMISYSGFIALYQLLFKPHYWEKTVHGYHLKTRIKNYVIEAVLESEEASMGSALPKAFRNKLQSLFGNANVAISGFFLVMSSGIANILNLIFNVYLGRSLSLSNFALISLIGSLLYLSRIPTGALGSVSGFKSGFLEGEFGNNASFTFWKKYRKYAVKVGFTVVIIWAILAPILSIYFKTNSILPFIAFSLILLVSFPQAVDKGLLSGKLLFGVIAITFLAEPAVKLLSAFLLIKNHLDNYVYFAIPISIVASFLIGWLYILSKKPNKEVEVKEKSLNFPLGFLFGSTLSGLSSMTFLSLDIVLAEHFLSPDDAGRYALISLVGKMIYFAGNLASQFLPPLVSRKEGAKESSLTIFNKTYIATFILCGFGFVVFGLFGYKILPLIYGQRILSLTTLVIPFAFGMMCFSLAKVVESYFLTKRIYSFSIFSFLLAVAQFQLISMFHSSVLSVVLVMSAIGLVNFAGNSLLYYYAGVLKILENNFADFLGLFEKREIIKKKGESLSILIFNWRDLQHTWSGGAEVYVQTLAQKWQEAGNSVTIFCGNDGKSKREETLDGVHIIRRGGFYTVYLWAFLYYVLRFRGNFDVVIDSENGIPFFTPLFVRVPKFLLIHHVHQEVFRKHLSLPLALLAQYLEGGLAPFIYKNTKVITVSESTKKDLEKLGFGKKNSITVVHPGIERDLFKPGSKAFHPTAVYLGRLKPYKNVDVAIKAFRDVVNVLPFAKLQIAGTGESMKELKNLTTRLGLSESVEFLGNVTDKEKAELLSEAWVELQPSMIEGWGITVIEANASGTPVIASNVAGLKDSVVDGKTGILVTVGSEKAFADAITKVFAYTSLRKSLSKEAFEWSKGFSWDLSAEKFYELITQDYFERQRRKMTLSSRMVFQR